jgi:hypothetical protein
MNTRSGSSEPVEPGDRAIMYIPIPLGTDVSALDVDPPTASHFRILRADRISREDCFEAIGLPGPAIRLELENVSSYRTIARVFMDLEVSRVEHQVSLERAVENWNRQAHELRAAPTEAQRRLIVAQIMAGRRHARGQA